MTATKVEEANSSEGSPVPAGIIGKRHLQIFLLFLGMTISYGLRVSMSVAIVAMTDNSTTANPNFETFEWNSGTKALILSSFFWGYTITQIPAGYLAGIWSAQRLLSMGIFVCGLLTLVVPFGSYHGSWISVCICRVGMGLCQGCLLPCAQTLIAKWAPPNERARLGTWAYAGGQFGTVVTMPISGLLAGSVIGWPSIFYIFGSIAIIWAIVFFFYGSDSPGLHPSISHAEKLYIEGSLGILPGTLPKNKLEKSTTPWKEIFTSAPMWSLIIVHCGQNWGYWMLLTEMPTYMKKVLKFNIEESGSTTALPYLANWLLSFPVSWLSDFALQKGVSRGTSRKVSNTIAHWGPGLALLSLCFVPTNNGNQILPVMILVISVGLNAGALCGFQINHIDLSPNYAGTMMSITNCIASVVAILAPLIVGEIVYDEEDQHLWHIVFYISAFIYFVGNLVFIIFGKAEIQWWNDPKEVKARKERKLHGNHEMGSQKHI
ncbi:putative inorganic phosphate cotransporter [Belonocnema kinseyi]|uniref:putative inorganic phosphate cotransporter n=1 Tax=Belonocnema kinseyi TaxID=2817044 RepID=UPI00143CF0C5|nr:putative inorganic phosphate cotransporter [Belonocnema kinseyi]